MLAIVLAATLNLTTLEWRILSPDTHDNDAVWHFRALAVSPLALIFLVRNDTPGPGVTTALLRVSPERGPASCGCAKRACGCSRSRTTGRSYTHITQHTESSQSSCSAASATESLLPLTHERAALASSRPLYVPENSMWRTNKYTRANGVSESLSVSLYTVYFCNLGCHLGGPSQSRAALASREIRRVERRRRPSPERRLAR